MKSVDAVRSAGDRGTRADFVWFACAMGLLLLAFAPALRDLVHTWTVRDEYSHGLLMPLVAGWILWDQRAVWRRLRPRPSLLGVLVLVPFLVALLVTEMRVFVWLAPFAFVGALLGVLLAVYGRAVVRPAFPILVVLLLMCPWPGRVQAAVTVPLKHVAAVIATGMLDLSGIPAVLDGNLIRLPGLDDLWVAEACSGIRSFISLFSLSVLVCLFWRRPWWIKLAVLAAVAPISIFVNGVRIWLTGFLSYKVSPEAAAGFFHEFEGILLFAAAGLLLVAWVTALAYLFPDRTSEATP